MNKKALAILGAIFLLIVGTLGFLVFSKYGKKSETDAGTQATSTPSTSTDTPVYIPPITTSTPPTAGSNIYRLASEQVVAPVLCFQPADPGNKKCDVAYFDNQGNLYQAFLAQDQNGLKLDRKSSITIQKKANISRILWPNPDENKNVTNDFIAEFNFGGRRTWSYFNAKTGVWTDLPPQVVSVDWLPGGQRIVYVWLDADGKTTINTGNPDTTGWQFLSDMYEADNEISVSPDGKNILFYRQFNSDFVNAINLTSSDAKLWRGLEKEGYNYGVQWSPDGSKFLFGKKDPGTQKYQLWVYDLYKGPNSLGVFTIPSKAVWAKDSVTVYAAVPNTGTADQNSQTNDDFYKIDTSTFEKKQYPAEQPVDGRNLFLNPDSTKLLFKNGQDGGLYYLDLNQ